MRDALAALMLACAPGAAAACDVALALTVDVSGSVDPREYRLQMGGLADALTDPTVADALIDAEAQVAVMQWSGASRQSVTVEWTAIRSRADLDRLATTLRMAPRAYRHFSTAIGDAVLAAAALHAEIAGQCERRVIDVSGDGRSNEGADLAQVRAAMIAGGITINGLAIETEKDDLTAYFEDELIGGPGAFVITATDYADYPRAIRRKLLREIAKPIVAAPGPTDDAG